MSKIMVKVRNRARREEVRQEKLSQEPDGDLLRGDMQCPICEDGVGDRRPCPNVMEHVKECGRIWTKDMEDAQGRRPIHDAPYPGHRTRGCKSVCKVRVAGKICGAQCTNQATDSDGWCNWHQYRCGHTWPPTWTPTPIHPGNRFCAHDSSLLSGRDGVSSYPVCSNFRTCGNWSRGITRCCNIWMCDTCGCWCPNGGYVVG